LAQPPVFFFFAILARPGTERAVLPCFVVCFAPSALFLFRLPHASRIEGRSALDRNVAGVTKETPVRTNRYFTIAIERLGTKISWVAPKRTQLPKYVYESEDCARLEDPSAVHSGRRIGPSRADSCATPVDYVG
jgi:hypothetical protein